MMTNTLNNKNATNVIQICDYLHSRAQEFFAGYENNFSRGSFSVIADTNLYAEY